MSAALRRLLRTLVQTQGARAAWLVALSVVSSLTAGLGVALLIPMLPLLGVAGPGPEVASGGGVLEAFRAVGIPPGLGPVLALFAFVSAVQALAQSRQSVEGALLAESFSRDLQARLFRAFQHARWETLLGARSSDVLHAAAVDLRRASVAVRLLPNLGSQALLAVVYVATAAALAPALTLAAAAAGGALSFLVRRQVGRVFHTGRELTARWRAQTGDLDQYLEGFKIARCYGASGRHRQRLEEAADELAAIQVRSTAQLAAGQFRFRVGALLLLCAFLYTAVRILALPPGQLLVLIYVFSRVVPLFSQFEQQLSQAAADLPAFAALESLVGRLEAAREEVPPAAGPPRPLLEEVAFRDVHYRYPDGGGRGVHGLSLRIPAGSVTALVGPSGAGKSTATDLLLGLLAPAQGEICVDGVPLALEDLESWRASIGYVTQETWLFHGTIRANLAWTCPEADEAALWRALEQADAGFVRELHEGLDTVVGDRGVLLSGGERQRLALARAFLRQPALLVLDEPTSSLDEEAEGRIMDVVEGLRGKVTVFVVTHRPGCAGRADRIYRIEDGRVVGTGSAQGRPGLAAG